MNNPQPGTPLEIQAGTPNMAGAIGLAAAIDYLEAIRNMDLY